MLSSQFGLLKICTHVIVIQRVVNNLDHALFYDNTDICAQAMHNMIMSQARVTFKFCIFSLPKTIFYLICIVVSVAQIQEVYIYINVMFQKEAQKRQRHRERLGERGRDVDMTVEEQEVAERDNQLLRAGEPCKPDKPVMVSDDDTRKLIRQKYCEIRRQPGESVITVELSNGANVTADHLCPRFRSCPFTFCHKF